MILQNNFEKILFLNLNNFSFVQNFSVTMSIARFKLSLNVKINIKLESGWRMGPRKL